MLGNFFRASLIFASNARNIHIEWGKVLHLSRLLCHSQILDYPEKDTDKRSSLFCSAGSDEEEKLYKNDSRVKVGSKFEKIVEEKISR
jgi:hypothetical protein